MESHVHSNRKTRLKLVVNLYLESLNNLAFKTNLFEGENGCEK